MNDAVVEPNLTPVTELRRVPLMRTVVPPAEVPVVGVIELMLNPTGPAPARGDRAALRAA